MTHYLGIDIGGTNIKYGVVAEDATIIEKHSIPTKAYEGRDSVVKRIIEICDKLQALCVRLEASGAESNTTGEHKASSIKPNAYSIGICAPGVVHPTTKRVQSPPNLPGWVDVDLAAEMSAAVGCPVYVENDANAAALAELHFGAGRGMQDFIYVTLGTGIGGGVVLDGKLYPGPNGEAGEIGHVVIDHHAVPASAARAFRAGVLEELAGNAGIVARFLEISGRTDIRDVEAIGSLAAEGNDAAREVLEQTGVMIGIGLSSAFAVLGVNTAIIGGGISRSEIIINSIQRTVKERSIPTIARNAKVVRAHFLNDAGLVGAAMLNRLSLPNS